MHWFGGIAAGTLVILIGAVASGSVIGPLRRHGDPEDVATRSRHASPRRRRIGLALVTILGAIVIGVFAALAILFIRVTWRQLAPALAERRRRAQIERDMPDALDLFVLIVHAGVTPRHAIGQLAERAPPSVRVGFTAVIARLERGEPLADALRAIDDELGPVALALTDALGAADRYGLPLEPVLQQLAAESRAARRRLDEAAARALPVKLSFPLVVCTLPSFVLLAIIPAVMAALSSLGGNTW